MVITGYQKVLRVRSGLFEKSPPIAGLKSIFLRSPLPPISANIEAVILILIFAIYHLNVTLSPISTSNLPSAQIMIT
jgi:hypothetical protein